MRIPPSLVLAAAAAAAFSGITSPAFAASVDLTSGAGGFVGTPGAGAFSDSYTFALARPTTVNILLASIAGDSRRLDLSGIVLNGPSGPITAAAYTPGPFATWTISDAVLDAGSYTLTASGTNSALLATYVGNIAVVASGGSTPAGGNRSLNLASGSDGFATTPGVGAFTNTYSFSIASPHAVQLLLASVAGGSRDLDFTSILLRGPGGDLMAASATRDPFETWTLSTGMLAAGAYSIIASGINSASVGAYVGTLAVVPNAPPPGNDVPEPASGALVVAGLAAGAALRRRKGPGTAV